MLSVQLWGYLDGLIELESGGYAILDLKSTQNTKWVVKNYALQLVREFGDLRSPTIGLVRLLSCLFAIERICENDGKNRWRRDEHCFLGTLILFLTAQRFCAIIRAELK